MLLLRAIVLCCENTGKLGRHIPNGARFLLAPGVAAVSLQFDTRYHYQTATTRPAHTIARAQVMKCKDAADVPEIIECPAEPDGTLLLKTLDDQFTGAQGLMYYDRETHLITPMADKGGVIQPPATGWQGRTFLVSFRPAVGGAKKRGHESALGGDGTPKEACKRLFVGNIPFSIKTKEELSDHFPGTTNIFLPTHTDTLRSVPAPQIHPLAAPHVVCGVA